MIAARLARLYATAFPAERPWSAAEFDQLLENPYTSVYTHPHGFALTRTIAGESELITLAVDPHHHRQGIAQTLVQTWLTDVTAHADAAYLDVAQDNNAACALYVKAGFVTTAIRKGYYARPNAPAVDAVLMRCALPLGHNAESAPSPPESG